MDKATKYYVASYSVWTVTAIGAIVTVLLIKKGLDAVR